jgi:hypothetical protein
MNKKANIPLVLLTIIYLLGFSLNAFCQQTTFQKIYPGLPNEVIEHQYELIQTPDHGYIMGNHSKLMKTDSLGQMEWMRNLTVHSFVMTTTPDGGYISTGGNKLIKLDSLYAISWVKTLSNSNSIRFYSIKTTLDNGYILGGNIDGLNFEVYYILMKTDSSGNVEWSKIYNSASFNDNFGSLSLTPDSGFIFCGYSRSLINFQVHDIMLINTDKYGNSQFVKRISDTFPTQSFVYHITSTYDNGFVITGYRNLHRFLMKIDSSGNILWMKKYEAEVNGDSQWVEETSDKGLISTGMLVGSDSGGLGTTAILMKTDEFGNFLWATELGGYTEVWPGCVKQVDDGGYIIGCRRPGGPSMLSFALIKTDSLGHSGGCLEDVPIVTVTNLTDTVMNEVIVDSTIILTSSPITLTTQLIGTEIDLCNPSSMPESFTAEFIFFPNPSTGDITLPKEFLGYELKLYDLTGRIVYNNPALQSSTVDLDFLLQGCFVVQLSKREKILRAMLNLQ